MRSNEFIKESTITELFQPGKKWQWEFNGSEEAIATFHVGEVPYLFHAYGADGQWEVEFKRDGKKLDRTQKFGLTGTGNSAEVMSTVVDIMRAFLDKYKDKIEVLIFSAKEDSRQGLYAKMVKRLLPDWIMKQDGEEFILIAPKQVDEEAKAIKAKGLSLKYAFNDRALIMKAFEPSTNNPLAYVKFVKEKKELYPQDLWVNDEYRSKGIAKTMYDTLKSEGYIINRSHDQTKAGAGFWDKHRGEDQYVWEDEVLDEMPLPADWDPQQMRQGATTFKSRLAYALERAKKLGTGSSRVATTIEYQGRPTVLKIAKNAKGLAQNSVEADILSDGYASQLGILIPIIDYDEQNREPSWIHTEMAQKANEKQLCHLMGCKTLYELVRFADVIAGKYRGMTSQKFIDDLVNDGRSENDIEKMTDYANILADLANSFDVELADFNRPANWGLYNGKPVIVDVGFNSNVMNQYYK